MVRYIPFIPIYNFFSFLFCILSLTAACITRLIFYLYLIFLNSLQDFLLYKTSSTIIMTEHVLLCYYFHRFLFWESWFYTNNFTLRFWKIIQRLGGLLEQRTLLVVAEDKYSTTISRFSKTCTNHYDCMHRLLTYRWKNIIKLITSIHKCPKKIIIQYT